MQLKARQTVRGAVEAVNDKGVRYNCPFRGDVHAEVTPFERALAAVDHELAR